VRFIYETDFRKIVSCATKTQHKLLLWLLFDYGENISSTLQLKKSDFYEQKTETGDVEFMLNWRPSILKRSRKKRSDINNYSETAELLKLYLDTLSTDEPLFPFDYRNAYKILKRFSKKAKVLTIPLRDEVKIKDFRSSMACDLLKKGWHTDEVNARLGHKPSSSEIDKYVNFLAIDRHKPKQKVENYKLKELQTMMEEERHQHKIEKKRISLELEEMRIQMKKVEIALKLIRK